MAHARADGNRGESAIKVTASGRGLGFVVAAMLVGGARIAVGSPDFPTGEVDVPEAFEVCTSCHAFTPDEEPLEGPSLWQVAGRPIASLDSYEYSAALRSVAGSWDRPTLDRFLTAPQSFAPGTTMTMGGLRDAGERAAVIEFLATLTAAEGGDD